MYCWARAGDGCIVGLGLEMVYSLLGLEMDLCILGQLSLETFWDNKVFRIQIF